MLIWYSKKCNDQFMYNFIQKIVYDFWKKEENLETIRWWAQFKKKIIILRHFFVMYTW